MQIDGLSKYGQLATVNNPLSKRMRNLSDSDCSGAILGVYLNTNEKGVDETTRKLSNIPIVQNCCHIGFSGLHNFDFIAKRRSAYGIICDFNPRNKQCVEVALAIIRTSANRTEFVKQMKKFIIEVENYSLHLFRTNKEEYKKALTFCTDFNETCVGIDEEIAAELERKESWLGSDDAFYHIKRLALEDRITAINMDIRDSQRCQKISNLLRDNAIQIDTLYLSNICQYMHEAEDKKKFVSSIHTLMDSNTLLINCPARDLFGGPLNQIVSRGKDYDSLQKDVRLFFNNDSPLYAEKRKEIELALL